jgi:hypothetical protein
MLQCALDLADYPRDALELRHWLKRDAKVHAYVFDAGHETILNGEG